MKIDDFFAELKRRNVQRHHRLRRLPVGWAAEKELAFQKLETGLRSPDRFVRGALKLLHFCDPLRGNPRFDKIVASLAPK